MIDDETIQMLLLAQNARFRVGVRFSQKNPTGYEVRPECILFGRKTIPESVADILKTNGLPVRNTYSETGHLQKLLRITKAFKDFTKEPPGWLMVSRFNGRIASLKFHDDVDKALKVLEDDSDAL